MDSFDQSSETDDWSEQLQQRFDDQEERMQLLDEKLRAAEQEFQELGASPQYDDGRS